LCHAKRKFINLDFKDSFMELDQKVKYALLAFAIGSFVLAGLGLHLGAHLKALEDAGAWD
jgi:hypothetical protein